MVRFTRYGDDNLDGVVNLADYTRIDAGYIARGTLAGWGNGDFNYDGTIDGSDYTLIDNAFNTQTPAAAAAATVTPATAVSPARPRPAGRHHPRATGRHPHPTTRAPTRAPVRQRGSAHR